MKISLYIALVIALTIPQGAEASGWNFWSWFGKKTEKAPVSIVATTTPSDNLSREELMKRIVELEDKLAAALKSVRELQDSKSQEQKVTTTSGVKQTSFDKDLITRVRATVVALDTATSSGSGIVIDSEGHVLAPVNIVLIRDANNSVVDIAKTVSVTFTHGSRAVGQLVGFNEEKGIAVFKVEKQYVKGFTKVGKISSISQNAIAYIFASSASKVNSLGADIVTGSVSQKTTSHIEIVAKERPLDNAAVVVSALGEIISIPQTVECKVLEEMKHCLSYKISSQPVYDFMPKVLLGMKLFKDKKRHTETEFLVKGQLEGLYKNVNSSGTIVYAITSVSGKNSFDNFNTKLVDDEDGKITKLYLNKLKVAADSLVKAFDVLKAQSHDLNIFFINNAPLIAELDVYQKAILKKIELDNALKYIEYKNKVDYWTAKKNEYDALLVRPQDATHDYLMEEGVLVEDVVKSLLSEKQRVLDSVSSETIALF